MSSILEDDDETDVTSATDLTDKTDDSDDDSSQVSEDEADLRRHRIRIIALVAAQLAGQAVLKYARPLYQGADCNDPGGSRSHRGHVGTTIDVDQEDEGGLMQPSMTPSSMPPPANFPSSPTPSPQARPPFPGSGSFSSKRKYSAQESLPLSVSSKRQRTSGGSQAMNTVGEQLGVPKVTKSMWASSAMEMLQDNEPYLSDDRVVAMCDLFNTDAGMANTYASLKKPGVRKCWILKHLAGLGFPDISDGMSRRGGH